MRRNGNSPISVRVAAKPQASSASLVEMMLGEAERQYHAGQNASAEALYRAVLALQPVHAQAAYNLGFLLHSRGQFGEAAAAYRYAVTLRPDYAEAFCNLGVALQEERKFDEAIAAYRQAIALRSDFAMAYCNLGVSLKAMNRLDDAVAAYRRAISISPEYDFAWANLAAVLVDQGKLSESVSASQRALSIQPDMVMGHFNLGTAFKHLGKLDAAATAFQRAVTLNPNMAEAHFSLAQTLLLQGNFQAGWQEYEWRWRLKDYGWLKDIHGTFHQPRWTGEPLNGRTILIYAEQGLGDSIQYLRFLPRVVAAGGKVILAIQSPLRRLFAGLPGVTLIDLDTVPLPSFDVHCPLLSLPLVFGITRDKVPATVPYLFPDPKAVASWRDRISAFSSDDALRVGVVWAGNPNQTGDRFRSPRLQSVFPLFDIPETTFIALQVGPGRQDLSAHPLPSRVLDLGTEIADLADTAAIMAGLDLVITSCTAPLHLAASLDVPTWAMIPSSPHFAWLAEGTESIWYPTLRLYRQTTFGTDWSDVTDRIGSDLTLLASAKRNRL